MYGVPSLRDSSCRYLDVGGVGVSAAAPTPLRLRGLRRAGRLGGASVVTPLHRLMG
jgi:hypothetical protein